MTIGKKGILQTFKGRRTKHLLSAIVSTKGGRCPKSHGENGFLRYKTPRTGEKRP